MGRLLSKRCSSHLVETCFRQGPFAQPTLLGVLTTTDPSDSRCGRPVVMNFHPSLIRRHTLPASHRSGSPRFPQLICRRPPPPITPESPVAADARCRFMATLAILRFTTGIRLHHLRKVGRSHWFHEAESGSLALRLTSSPQRASTHGSPRAPPHRLHVERAINMVSTFQLTRSARLHLAHRRRRTG